MTAAQGVTGRVSDAMMIELMAFAGLRPGEVVALQVQHVDLPSRRIKIRRTATIDIHGAAIFGEPKHGERREVPIAPHLLPELKQLIEGRPAAVPLVDSARGQFINIHNWRGRVWSKAVEAAGLGGRDLSPKALRHTAASMAIAAFARRQGRAADVRPRRCPDDPQHLCRPLARSPRRSRRGYFADAGKGDR